MLRLTPADPAAIIAGDNANTEQVQPKSGKRLGLTSLLFTQFVIWGESAARRPGQILLLQAAGGGANRRIGWSQLCRSPSCTPCLRHDRCHTLSACSPHIGMAVGLIGSLMGLLGTLLLSRFRCSFIGYLLIYRLFAIELNRLPVQGYQRMEKGLGRLASDGLILPTLALSGGVHRADRPHRAHQPCLK